jgi:hypothetical protein
LSTNGADVVGHRAARRRRRHLLELPRDR